jgi:hypothetical protein
MIRDHFAPFVALLFGLPAVTFLAMKFWTAGRSAKAQRTTSWFVPTDLESESARMHYAMQHQSVAFAHQLHPTARHAVAARKSSSRRSV